MQDDERDCLTAFLRAAATYVEFGCGGSTVLASTLVSTLIVAVDSSQTWLDQVAAACAAPASITQPRLILADLGPTGEWGRPVDDACRDRWPSYSQSIWQHSGTSEADLYLVDGRFRVACFLEVVLRCRPDAVILIHDFAPRQEYHVVREFAREVAVASNLSAFVRRPGLDQRRLFDVLDHARYHPG